MQIQLIATSVTPELNLGVGVGDDIYFFKLLYYFCVHAGVE